MAPTASIKYRFSTTGYRGGTKVWSTTFHLTGGSWQDSTHFNTFSDAVESDLLSALYPLTTLVDATGYDPGSSLPVFSKSYNAAGTATVGSVSYAPLECALLLKFTTDARSTKNHPVYLFNYIHNAQMNASSTPDVPLSGMVTHWTTRAANLVAGYSDGTLTRKRAGPNGAVAQSSSVETYLTHRDFPR